MADIPLSERDMPAVPAQSGASGEAKPADAPWPSTTQAWYTLNILTFAMMFSFLDRQIMTLMIGPIKADMHLNDTEVSFLLGLAFVCIYAFSSLPVARLADRAAGRLLSLSALQCGA